jgi:hypothetical protein
LAFITCLLILFFFRLAALFWAFVAVMMGALLLCLLLVVRLDSCLMPLIVMEKQEKMSGSGGSPNTTASRPFHTNAIVQILSTMFCRSFLA